MDTLSQNKLSRTRRNRVRVRVAGIRTKYNLCGPMTKADFFRICKGEGIEICRLTCFRQLFKKFGTNVRGMHFTIDKRSFITMACLWEPIFDLFVAGHELGHGLLGHNAGNTALAFFRFEEYQHSTQELEANYFSQMMLSGE